MKLNCLIFNTDIRSQIEDVINEFVVDRLENKSSVKFNGIYAELRKAGIEIDMESAGVIYNDMFINEGDLFSTQDEVEKLVGADIVKHQQEIARKISGEKDSKTDAIGNLPPEKSIAKNIATFFDRMVNRDAPQNSKTVMRAFQEIIKKAMVAELPNMPTKSKESIHSMLEYFFNAEKKQFQRLDGGVNTLETLHKAVKKEVNKYVDGIVEGMEEDEAESVREQWDNYTQGVTDSMYEIMLGKGQQNQLLKEALEQIEIDGESIVDKNGNVKWSMLSQSGNVDKVKKSIVDLFKKGVKDKDGIEHQYSDIQAERIGEYLSKRYEQKLIAYQQKQITNQRVKQKSPKNVISDFIKDMGLFHLAKKNGVFEGSVSEWTELLKRVEKEVTQQKKEDVINEIKKEFEKYLIANNISNPKEKINELERIIREKLLPNTATPNAIQRIIALNKVNNGVAFEQSKQFAINKLTGVSDLDQATLTKLKQLSELSAQIVSISSSNPLAGHYALQAHQQVHRLIREIVEANQADKSKLLSVSRYINHLMTSTTGTLLLNPFNISENITTGIASNVSEMIRGLIENPKLFSKTVGGNIKTFWSSFFSHLHGGAFSDVIGDEDITNSLSSGEKYRLKTYVDKFGNAQNTKEGFKAFGELLMDSPNIAVSLLMRYIMNGFDVAFHSVLLRRQMLTSMYGALQNSGLSKSETLNVLDEATNIDTYRINQEVDDIINAMRSAGLSPTVSQRDLMRLEMRMAQYEESFQNYVDDNNIPISKEHVSEQVRALLKASNQVAKDLGGKKMLPTTDFISLLIYAIPKGALSMQQKLFEQSKKDLSEGRYKKAARKEFLANVFSKNGFSKFAGGVANFLNLGVTATPWGFVQAANLQGQMNNMLEKKSNVGNLLSTDADDIAKYYELYNLRKSIITRAAIGSIALMSAIAMYYSGDDDDDDELLDGVAQALENLNQTKSGRRLGYKTLPVSLYAMSLLMYPPKGDQKLNTKSELLFEVASNVLNKNYDGWDMLKQNLQRAKSDNQRQAAIIATISSIWTGNANQIEQISRANEVLRSMVDKDFIKEVRKDEHIAASYYKKMNKLGDAALGNGIMSTFLRAIDGDKPIDRFSSKKQK